MKQKKLLSILLALCMIIGLMPMTVFADDTDDGGAETSTTFTIHPETAPAYDADTGTYINGNIEYYTCEDSDSYFTYDSENDTYVETMAEAVTIPYFSINDNGTHVRITAYNGNDAEIVIPDTVPDNYPNEAIRGRTITSINQSAFKDNTTITKVVMGDSIKHIGWEAFRRASNLEEIFIGTGLNQLESGIFYDCPALRKFTCTKVDGSIKVTSYPIADSTNIIFYGMHSGSFCDIVTDYKFVQSGNITYVGLDEHQGVTWKWSAHMESAKAVFNPCAYCDYRDELEATVSFEVITPATTTTSGVGTYTAVAIDESGNEYSTSVTSTIPPIGHEHHYVPHNAAAPTYDAYTATYKNGNTEYYTCDGCDECFVYDAETDTYSETTEDAVQIPYFDIDDNGTYVRIMGYNGGDAEVIIPDKVPDNYNNVALRGKTITSVNQAAFRNNKTVTMVVMGDYIQNIGWEAFRRASNLEEIFIGSGLRKLDSYVFFECPALKKVTCSTVSGSIQVTGYPFDKNLFSNITFYGMHSGSFRNAVNGRSFVESGIRNYIGLDAHKDVIWNWSDDLGSATATFDPCSNCDYTDVLDAAVDYEVTTSPTVWSEGIGTYTAVAVDENGYKYTDTKKVTIPKVAEPKFETLSLVLSGKIGVNFFMNLPQIEGVDYSDSYMEFTVDGKGGFTTTDVFDENFMNDTNEFYGFTCYINSIQMADTITAVFHYGDGQTVQTTYSVRDYLEIFEGYAESYDDTTVALIRALGDYGHYVQLFLSGERGWTIGVDHAEMDKYYTGDFDLDAIKSATEQYAARKDGTDNAIKKISVSLVLDSGTDIRVHFKPAYDCSLSASVDGSDYEDIELSGGRFLVEITDIAAHDLGTWHNIEAVTDSGRTRLELSALSYVNAVLSGSTDDNSLNAAAAIYNYYAAAQAYKESH